MKQKNRSFEHFLHLNNYNNEELIFIFYFVLKGVFIKSKQILTFNGLANSI